MASSIYGGLVLSAIIILLALQYSTANGHEGNVGTKRKCLRGSATRKDVSLDSNDAFDHDIALGGRKMLRGLDKKSSLISGKNKPSNLDDPRDAHSSSKHVFTKHEDAEKDDDSKAFLEAADEVANLMRKDYKGANRPKRKPPINNHEPNY